MLNKELLTLPVTELAKLIKNRQLSSVDLTTMLLQHAHQYNPEINAYISFRDERALAGAALHEEIAQGNYKGTFHGIPMGIKDNIYLGG